MESDSKIKPVAAVTASTAPKVKMLINGRFIDSNTFHWEVVINPATQEVLATVPFSTSAEIEAAVTSAKEAFKNRKNTPIPLRALLFFRFG